MGTIIDGKMVAGKIKDQVKLEVGDLLAKHAVAPGLATILVGDDPASQVYVKNKILTATDCGIISHHFPLNGTTSQKEILNLIHRLNEDASVHGILVQMPLPKHINAAVVFDAIAPEKDVDGFTTINRGLLFSGQNCLKPCTPLGIMELLKFYQVPLAGAEALVIGRSLIVGKPVALFLLEANATVTMAHSRTKDLADKVKAADIVIAALGKPLFVKGEWIKPGAVVIDVGVNRRVDGKLCGDVEFEAVKIRASLITPVPGDVGPMTIAMLMQNTVGAAKQVHRV